LSGCELETSMSQDGKVLVDHGLRQRMENQIPGLRRYARALTRNETAADDLVQDTLVRGLGMPTSRLSSSASGSANTRAPSGLVGASSSIYSQIARPRSGAWRVIISTGPSSR
jgi:hypothetical protein